MSSIICHWHLQCESRTMLLSWAPWQQIAAQSGNLYQGCKWSLASHLLSWQQLFLIYPCSIVEGWYFLKWSDLLGWIPLLVLGLVGQDWHVECSQNLKQKFENLLMFTQLIIASPINYKIMDMNFCSTRLVNQAN